MAAAEPTPPTYTTLYKLRVDPFVGFVRERATGRVFAVGEVNRRGSAGPNEATLSDNASVEVLVDLTECAESMFNGRTLDAASHAVDSFGEALTREGFGGC